MLPVLADGTNRTTVRDMRLGPHLIPRGTMVWVPLKATFNSPHLWDRPDQFIPVRAQIPRCPAVIATLKVEHQQMPGGCPVPDLLVCCSSKLLMMDVWRELAARMIDEF